MHEYRILIKASRTKPVLDDEKGIFEEWKTEMNKALFEFKERKIPENFDTRETIDTIKEIKIKNHEDDLIRLFQEKSGPDESYYEILVWRNPFGIDIADHIIVIIFSHTHINYSRILIGVC